MLSVPIDDAVEVGQVSGLTEESYGLFQRNAPLGRDALSKTEGSADGTWNLQVSGFPISVPADVARFRRLVDFDYMLFKSRTEGWL